MNKPQTIRSPWLGAKQSPQQGRKVDNQVHYNAARWRSVSTQRRNSPDTALCEVCRANARERFGDVVDHIIPVAEGGAWWDERNHMTMCHPHHNSKSGYEKHRKVLVTAVLNSEGDKIPANRRDIFDVLLAGGASKSPKL